MRWPARESGLEVAMEMLRSAKPPLRRMAQVDRHLEDQLRRALVGVPSKIAEGNRRLGKDRIYLFSAAAGSADEAINALAHRGRAGAPA